MKQRIVIVGVMFLTLLVSSPATGKNRPTVDASNGDTCFADPETDKNCPGTGNVGAICYCCYDDGCWICGTDPMPGNECVWDPAYRASLAPSLSIGEMSSEDPHYVTQQALLTLLQKKNVLTKKDLVEEVMSARKARLEGTLERGKLKESVATQKAINEYFHASVVPRLKTCWGRLQGRGSVEIQSRYEDDGKGGWAFRTLRAGRSDLPKGQTDAAISCMQQAASGTTFPRNPRGKARSNLIDWVWPVPLPSDADHQVARMRGAAGGEGSGCDGHGAPARCVTCSGSPLTCVYVCVGSDTCEVQATTPGGFNSICSEGGQCASGGLFGVVGGAVMY